MFIELVMSFSYLILSCPLLLLSSVLSGIRVFSNESVLPIKWSVYWSFSFSIILPMNSQGWFPLRLVWSPYSPRDSQESSAPHCCGGWQIQMHRAGWQPGNSGKSWCGSVESEFHRPGQVAWKLSQSFYVVVVKLKSFSEKFAFALQASNWLMKFT